MTDFKIQPIITFSSVSKNFGEISALENINISVNHGEFLALIGPSGCGKSTILRLASGLDSPSSGKIDISTDKVGYVFQDATLMPWRTVRKNVGLLAQLEKFDKEIIKKKTDDILELVGLEDFADHYPFALSGGMKMRASLARSLVLDPELFLFDEPFGALDLITRGRLNVELLQLYTSKKFTSLFVTHSVEEALFLSSRVIVFSGRPGKIKGEFEVPFKYPRDTKIRYSSEFAELSGEVGKILEDSS
ncbi:MAG: ABC transporter ATP-binding protein [Gammaproteobacteria bacterium]|jgi:NitT/TauT family transport system ATP-binding protein|nr:ABC transporter ATP-binding protein [Gammaproteobacteria bacterium]|tara:strand:- start:4543 stop:5286 length:744 start_codon:yes stop_codon:yes gene_type:complete